MAFKDELRVLLTGDSKGLTKEMGKAKQSVSGFSTGVKKVGGMVAGVFAVGGMVSYAKKIAAVADEQNKLARRLDITKGQADALELSFMKGGQSLKESEKSLDVFNRKLGELESGEKTAADAFERLGITAEDFIGKDYNQKLVMVKKRMDGMTASARAFAAQELFGRGGAKIYEGLSGLEAADEMIKEVNGTLGLTGDQVGNIEAMNDAWTETSKKLELITTAVLTKLAPGIEDIVGGLGRAAVEAVKFTSKFNEGIEATATRIEEKGFFGGIASAVGSRFGFGASDVEVQASAENRRRLAAGVTPETELKQASAKADIADAKSAAEEQAKEEERLAAQNEAMEESFQKLADLMKGAVNPELEAAAKFTSEFADQSEVLAEKLKRLQELGDKGLIDKDVLARGTDEIKKQMQELDPEYQAMKKWQDQMESMAGGGFMEPVEQRRPTEAGITSAGGLYSVAMQGMIGGRQSEEQKQVSLQQQMVQWLEMIARSTRAGQAYV